MGMGMGMGMECKGVHGVRIQGRRRVLSSPPQASAEPKLRLIKACTRPA